MFFNGVEDTQLFRNLAMKKPMVSLSAWSVRRGAGDPEEPSSGSVWSQLSSGLNLWRSRSWSGDRPAPSMPSEPTWGSYRQNTKTD